MKKIIITLLFVPLVLGGCGQSKAEATTPPNKPTSFQNSNWVSFWRDSGLTNYYILSNVKTRKVGKLVYDFKRDSMSQGPSGWSTNDNNAIDVYTISNVDVDSAVAVKMENGSFLEADAVGSLPVLKDTNVKSITVSVSALPGHKQATFTTANNKVMIDRILKCIKNSREVGLEPPTPGKGGYPPQLVISTTDGNIIAFGPAMNWSVKKLANGSTEITGKYVTGYIAMASPNQPHVLRLYAPQLYNFIMNHES